LRRLNLRLRAPETSPQTTTEASPGPRGSWARLPKRALGVAVAALVITLIGVTISAQLVDYASGPTTGYGLTGGDTDPSSSTPGELAFGEAGDATSPSPDETQPWAMPGAPSPGGETFGTSPSPDPTPQPVKAASTPRPTTKPTTKPAPNPTSKPTSKPKAQPAAAKPAGIAVPSSIDSTGKRDASAALNAFIGRVKNGSTIVFRKGGVYRLNGPVKFAHRHNLTLNGNGATLKSYGPATESGSLFWLGSFGGPNTGITIKNFKLVGHSSSPGVYRPRSEGAAGILVDTGSHIDIHAVTISAVWGDCLKVNSWASYISFHDSTCASAGRNGVTIIAGRNVTVQRVAFRRNGYNVFDIEANNSSEGAKSIKFLSNKAGTWTNAFFSANGANGSVVSGVTVSGNRITGGTLLTVVTISRRQNIVFTNNTSTVRGRGPILRFAHIDGLTVRGNHQPLSSGSLVSISDCTSVRR
jgi:hypothetical protein